MESLLRSSAPGGDVPTVPTNRGTRLATRVSAVARIPWSGQDGAIAWAEFSKYPLEAGVAGRRFATYRDRLPLPALWYAVAEAAIDGHHAAGALIEPYLRWRCARIGEVLREIEKREEEARPERIVVVRPRLRSVAEILGGAAGAKKARMPAGLLAAHDGEKTRGGTGAILYKRDTHAP